jgi:hypothetical protein
MPNFHSGLQKLIDDLDTHLAGGTSGVLILMLKFVSQRRELDRLL